MKILVTHVRTFLPFFPMSANKREEEDDIIYLERPKSV